MAGVRPIRPDLRNRIGRLAYKQAGLLIAIGPRAAVAWRACMSGGDVSYGDRVCRDGRRVA